MGGRFSWLTQLGWLSGLHGLFRLPARWAKGLWISACTLLSGVVWALVIINGSALAPHMDIIGYVMTGIVAFLMCIQQSNGCFHLYRARLLAHVQHLQGRATGDWLYLHWYWARYSAMR